MNPLAQEISHITIHQYHHGEPIYVVRYFLVGAGTIDEWYEINSMIDSERFFQLFNEMDIGFETRSNFFRDPASHIELRDADLFNPKKCKAIVFHSPKVGVYKVTERFYE